MRRSTKKTEMLTETTVDKEIQEVNSVGKRNGLKKGERKWPKVFLSV